jgi:uncharacterized membrane protein YfcA
MAEALAMSKAALAVARSVHYVYPSALFVWFLGSQAASFLSLKTATASKKPYQKRLFVFLQMIVIASYVSCHNIARKSGKKLTRIFLPGC